MTESDAHIYLRVKGQDGHDVHLMIKRRTPLKKLMKDYCDRKGVDFHTMRFFFDGKRIRGEQTPEELQMEYGDKIEAFMEMRGFFGGINTFSQTHDGTMNEEGKYKKPEHGDAHIHLKVQGQDGHDVHFMIKRKAPLKKLMNAYCDRKAIDYDTIRFLFDGDRIRGEQTPEELKMEDGDEIDALGQQIAGSMIIYA